MKIKFNKIIFLLAFFISFSSKTISIFGDKGYEESIKNYENLLNQAEEKLNSGDINSANELFKKAEKILNYIKENAVIDIINNTPLRAFLASLKFLSNNLIYLKHKEQQNAVNDLEKNIKEKLKKIDQRLIKETTKKTIKTLKIPPEFHKIWPQQSLKIDLNDEEPILLIPFIELIEQENLKKLPFILAVVLTKKDNNYFEHFFYFQSINEWIFDKKLYGANIKNNTNPLNGLPIEDLLYFQIKNLKEPFEYVGSLSDLLSAQETPIKTKLEKLFDNISLTTKNKPSTILNSAIEFSLTGNYLKAKRYYEVVAAQKSDMLSKAKAQFALGIIYYNGLGVPINYTNANQYFRAVASQNADLNEKGKASSILGDIYYYGHDVKIDYSKAKQYFEEAQNFSLETRAYTDYMLGDIYYYGRGVAVDYSKAKQYFESAAAQDDDLNVKNAALIALKQFAAQQ